MPRKWSKKEEKIFKNELIFLYVKKNKTIKEIGKILRLAENTIYDRIVRLGIPILRHKKTKFNNRNFNIVIPKIMSGKLAEFIGIMLGDGHLTPTQVTVTLGTKEKQYAIYVSKLMGELFGVRPKIALSKQACFTVYLGSTVLVRWLLKNYNLVYNKVKSQVCVPKQCFLSKVYMSRLLRGLLDTDGSVYRIKSGIQMSFTNKSKPLLQSAKDMFDILGYHPSKISYNKIYLTRKADIEKYKHEIGFANNRHSKRLKIFEQQLGRFV